MFQSMARLWSKCGKTVPARRKRNPVRLRVEALEDRLVLTGLSYGGGPLLANAGALAVYFGPAWGTPALQQRAGQINSFLGVVTNSFAMDQLSEDNSATQAVDRGTFLGQDTTTDRWATTPLVINGQTVTTVGDETIRQMLVAEINAGRLPVPDANTLYTVYTPPNVTVTDARFRTLDGHPANSIQDFRLS
jgi:hypothetical protein